MGNVRETTGRSKELKASSSNSLLGFIRFVAHGKHVDVALEVMMSKAV
jgi:hypothetical protein